MIVVETPLRISFVGGGTDFEDYYFKHDSIAFLNTDIEAIAQNAEENISLRNKGEG